LTATRPLDDAAHRREPGLSDTQRTTAFRVGEWQFEPSLNRLSRGEDTVELEPLASRLLELFATYPGQVFSADELVEAVWKGRIVSDNPIYKLIATLRRALDDDPGEPRYIETIRKRGYRLIAQVEAIGANDAPPAAPAGDATPARPDRRTWAVAAVIVAVVSTAVGVTLTARNRPAAPSAGVTPVIAVLPFDDMSESGDQAYLGNGIAEEIIHALAAQRRFGVVGRTSTFAVAEVEGDIRRIGDLLEATHVVEGSIRKSGNAFRITAQLIDTRTGLHEWSGNFDRPNDELLNMQTEIATRILDAIAESIDADPVAALPDAPTPDTLSAYEAYLRGRHRLAMRGAAAAAEAERAFLDALSLDRNLVQAMEGLVETQYVLSFHGAKGADEAYALAEVYAERALRISPERAEVHVALGRLAELGARPGDAEQAYRTALELDARNPEALGALAWLLSRLGRNEEAQPVFDRAIDVEPASPLLTVAAAMLTSQLGDYDCSERLFSRAVEIAPTMMNARFGLGSSLWHLRRDMDAALMQMRRAAEIDPENRTPPAFAALIALEADDPDTAKSWLLTPDQTGYDGYWPTLARLAYGVYTGADETAASAAMLLTSYSPEPMAHRYLRDAALAAGKPLEAIAVYPSTLLGEDPQVTPITVRLAADLAWAFAVAGDRAAAEKLATAVLGTTARMPRNSWTGYWLADIVALTVLDGPEAGLARLQEAVDGGWHLMAWWELERNRALESLRALPGYVAVIASLRSREPVLPADESLTGRTLEFCDRLD
jgi:TolB-like protein/DNA-binding winged helix-turn-helix (wHTH) protein/Tfp pilus assembly protein PilF